ncbi:MAG: hypothetical protein F6K08_31395 [Okeania sp. SIO1H6]|nr:hypothetical protein [Okeania sp. SIO1H6]
MSWKKNQKNNPKRDSQLVKNQHQEICNQDLRMRHEKLGFEIASLSVAMTEIRCRCVSPSNL